MTKTKKIILTLTSLLLVFGVSSFLVYRNITLKEHKNKIVKVEQEIKVKEKELKEIETIRNDEMTKNIHISKVEQENKEKLDIKKKENEKLEKELEQLQNETVE